jgi:hypothetical protein
LEVVVAGVLLLLAGDASAGALVVEEADEEEEADEDDEAEVEDVQAVAVACSGG